jgi:hypothetical protein
MREGGWRPKPTEPKKTFGDAFYQYWVPPLIAGALAAAGAYFLALKNEESTQKKTYLELKVRHADETALALSDYVSIWRRLIIRCAKHEADAKQLGHSSNMDERKKLDELMAEQNKGIEELAARLRPATRDKLFARLDVLQLYFSDGLVEKVGAFQSWDEEQQIKTCSQMPDIRKFQNYREDILRELRREVKP